jgi:hypothetical protein
MTDTAQELPELKIPERLQLLIKFCEKGCVADCCGICAFDFTAVHVASFISTHTGIIRDSDVKEWNVEIDKLESNFNALRTHGDGLVCVVPSMNQFFTADAVRALLSELRSCVASSKQVFELSESLASSVRAYKVMNDFRDHAAAISQKEEAQQAGSSNGW